VGVRGVLSWLWVADFGDGYCRLRVAVLGVLGGDGDLLIASGGLCRRWVPMSGTGTV
jgi:hypothetical protein